MHRTAALFSLVSLLAACGDETPAPDEFDAAGPAPVELAIVERDGAQYTFQLAENGAVTVSELADASSESQLTRMVSAAEPTPLEIFGVLTDAHPPIEMIEHHESVAAEMGLELTPRDPVAIGRLMIEPAINFEYAADCTRSADRAWFNAVRSSAGAGWSWYWSSSSGSPKVTAKAYNKAWFITHMCNHNRTGGLVSTGGGLIHFLRDKWTTLGTQNVEIGKRSVHYVSGYPTDYYTGSQSYYFPYTPSGPYRLGAYAP